MLRTTLGRSVRRMGVPARQPLHTFDNLFNGSSAEYLDGLYEKWCEDPASVNNDLAMFFEKADTKEGAEELLEENLRPISQVKDASATPKSVLHALRVGWMLRLWAVRGHRLANLDPLNLAEHGDFRKPGVSKVSDRPLFHPANFGFKPEDMSQVVDLAVSDKIGGFVAMDQTPTTVQEIYDRLKETYGGKIGWEYMHIYDAKKLLWLRKRIETPNQARVELDYKELLHWLGRAQYFEEFLSIKFSSMKRFGLDGGEVLIPGLIELLEKSSDLGVEHVVMGMPHRGRLNVLANVAGKPLGAIFNEFQGKLGGLEFGSGDVKYHLGFSEKREMRNGKTLGMSLVANPSHLEAVNPVVQGKVKAKQYFANHEDQGKVLGVIMHGDAAFAGQGVCFESMGLGDLTEYGTGGIIHIIVNNQIGFTTDPVSSRSTPYCSDLGKIFGAPIFHVNADAIPEVIRVFKMAAEWRAKWKTDVVIDLICYRRYGHNETDEPLFTQPVMYKKIKDHPPQVEQYTRYLIENDLLAKKDIDSEKKKVSDIFKTEFKNMDQYQHRGRSPRAEWLESFWAGFKSPLQLARIKPTGIDVENLTKIGTEITTFPQGFNLHSTLARVFSQRKASIESGEGIDWSTAESLAFATLLAEGNHVRVSGQDVERGTFSQRHATVHDQSTGESYQPLANIAGATAKATIINSSLSEFGVLGFEVGYSSENPNQLVIWEAQFGDFANTAQVIFDQFLSSGETKWFRQCGLVVNLPHGYDGAGPEHSSGRLERFLQQTPEPEENPMIDPIAARQQCCWQVCYPSTPANYFHLLRRQIHRDFRKPLVLFFAKSTLRAPNVSSLSELGADSEFQPVIDDDKVTDVSKVRKIIFCSGQIYHLLDAKRSGDDVAIVRIEELAPFPWGCVTEVLKKYPESADLQWCQEEPKNMGAWLFVEVRIQNILSSMGQDSRDLIFNGRAAAAAPATGHKKLHDMEHATLLQAAFA